MDGREYRIILNEISVISIILSFALWGFYGYFNIYAIALESFFIIFSFIFLFLSNLNCEIEYHKNYFYLLRYLLFALPALMIMALINNIYLKIILIILIIAALVFVRQYYDKNNYQIIDSNPFIKKNVRKISLLIILAVSAGIVLTTFFIKFAVDDEYLIDIYSAKQFLNGLNPYLHSTTANLYAVFKNFNLDYITPTTNGNAITFMGYPALAFLAYVPYFFIGKLDNTIIGLFSIIPIVLVYKKFQDKRIALLAIMAILLNFIYLYSAADAVIGILWVSFLMVSYYFIYKNPILSGIFFGLSISAKQFAVFIFPFMIYMIYREKGLKKALQWFLIATAIFLTINAYFIILSPVIYIKDILSPELDHLIGFGYGISQIAFLGYLYIPEFIFTISLFVVFGISILVYIKYYDLMKYELFTFPILMFFFNYRVLPGYFIYWPILSLLVIEDIKYGKKVANIKNIKINSKQLKKIAYTSLIFIVIIAVIFSGINYYHTEKVDINSIHPEIKNNNISSIEINLTYQGNLNENLYFRAIVNETNYNGYLFNVSNDSIYPGQTKTFCLTPVRGETIPANVTLKIIVYNNTNLGYATYKINDYTVTKLKNIMVMPPKYTVSLSRV
ncbi:MAG: hypothetical protein QXZ44_07060 [Ferroplasma sp.]